MMFSRVLIGLLLVSSLLHAGPVSAADGPRPLGSASASATPGTPSAGARELIQEGINYLVLEQTKKAEECFLKAKTNDPYSEEAYNFLGLLYLQQGLLPKAEEMLMRAIAIEPLYLEALRNLGKLYLQQERYADAALFLRRAFNLDRDQAYTSYLLGMAYYFDGQVEKSVKAYEEALVSDPNLPAEVHYNLGVAYHETGRALDALRQYELVLKQEPQHLNALNNLGLVYSNLGERDRAVDLFNRVISVEPGNVKAHINLGNAFLNAKQWNEAEASYKTAISLDDKDVSPQINLGVVQFEKGEFESARNQWESILQTDPDNLRVLSVMASGYLEKKKFDEAIAIFKRMVKLMPNNGGVANTLGYLLAEQNKELPFAKELIENALSIDCPNRAAYLDSLAWVLFRQGKAEKAREIQQRAMKMFRLTHEPITSEVHLHMGRIYERLKNTEAATIAYEDAVKSNSDPDVVRDATESLAKLKPQAERETTKVD